MRTNRSRKRFDSDELFEIVLAYYAAADIYKESGTKMNWIEALDLFRDSDIASKYEDQLSDSGKKAFDRALKKTANLYAQDILYYEEMDRATEEEQIERKEERDELTYKFAQEMKEFLL